MSVAGSRAATPVATPSSGSASSGNEVPARVTVAYATVATRSTRKTVVARAALDGTSVCSVSRSESV
jgi:hypothetical protein